MAREATCDNKTPLVQVNCRSNNKRSGSVWRVRVVCRKESLSADQRTRQRYSRGMLLLLCYGWGRKNVAVFAKITCLMAELYRFSPRKLLLCARWIDGCWVVGLQWAVDFIVLIRSPTAAALHRHQPSHPHGRSWQSRKFQAEQWNLIKILIWCCERGCSRHGRKLRFINFWTRGCRDKRKDGYAADARLTVEAILHLHPNFSVPTPKGRRNRTSPCLIIYIVIMIRP